MFRLSGGVPAERGDQFGALLQQSSPEWARFLPALLINFAANFLVGHFASLPTGFSFQLMDEPPIKTQISVASLGFHIRHPIEWPIMGLIMWLIMRAVSWLIMRLICFDLSSSFD